MADTKVSSLANSISTRDSGKTVSEASSQIFGSATRYDNDCPYARDGNYWVISYDGSIFEKFNVDSSSNSGILGTFSDGSKVTGKRLKDNEEHDVPCSYQFSNTTSSRVISAFFTNSGAFTWHLKKVSATSSNIPYTQYVFGVGLPIQTKKSIDLNDYVGDFGALGFQFYQTLGTGGSYVLRYVRNSDGTSKNASCTISNSQPICSDLVSNTFTCSDLVDGIVNCKNSDNTWNSKTVFVLLQQHPFFVNVVTGTDSKGNYLGAGFFSKSFAITLPKVQSTIAPYWYHMRTASGNFNSRFYQPGVITSVSEPNISTVGATGIVTYYNTPLNGQFWSPANTNNPSNVLTLSTKFGINIRSFGDSTAAKFSDFKSFQLHSLSPITNAGSAQPNWSGNDINAPVYISTTNSANQPIMICVKNCY
jgi:hypothetical protein